MLGVLPLSTQPLGAAAAPAVVDGTGGASGGPKWAPLLIILSAQK